MSSVHAPKIQRWIDLVAALLRRRYGVTFEELRRDVPAYAQATGRDALLRMFERDKDELRKFGVAIEAVIDDDGIPSEYLLRRTDFYLPYLLATSGTSRPASGRAAVGTAPAPVEREGYRDLPRLSFLPDELSAVADAAERARDLGDPLLATDAESAIRKLAFDLPLGALASAASVAVVAGRFGADARVFELLEKSLRARKRVSFAYRSPDRDEPEQREVEPYGLFFLGGNWYVAAHDTGRDGLRNFRLNRIEGVTLNPRREQTPDYVIPRSFDLREHARSRQAWELGDGEAVEAVVSFHVTDGAAAAAARLGTAASDDGDTRRFRVRRMSPFVRWLLSFGGDAMAVSPDELRTAVRSCARETLALYVKSPAPADEDGSKARASLSGGGP